MYWVPDARRTKGHPRRRRGDALTDPGQELCRSVLCIQNVLWCAPQQLQRSCRSVLSYEKQQLQRSRALQQRSVAPDASVAARGSVAGASCGPGPLKLRPVAPEVAVSAPGALQECSVAPTVAVAASSSVAGVSKRPRHSRRRQ